MDRAKLVLVRVYRRLPNLFDSRRRVRFFVSAIAFGVVLGLFVGLLVFKGLLAGSKDEAKGTATTTTNFTSGENGKDEFGAFDGVFAEDGSLYLVGDNRIAGAQNFRVVKLNSSTLLERNFARRGIMEIDFGGTADSASSMVIGHEGKLLAIGVTNIGGNNDFALMRFDSNGVLDSAFGKGGKINIDFNGGNDKAFSAVELASGKIIVGGSSRNETTKDDFALLRLNADGSVDNNFGEGGKVTLDFEGRDERIVALNVSENGKIIAVGNSQIGKIAIARFTADGRIDREFAQDGKMTIDVDGGARTMVADSKGRMVVGGGTAFGRKSILMRLSPDGNLDKSFRDGGISFFDFGRILALAIGKDGKIIAAGDGNFSEEKKSDIVLTGFLENGAVDSSFGDKGRIIADFDNAINTVLGMNIDSGGKIQVVVTTEKNGFTKHGLVTVKNRKNVDDFKFNLEDW